MTQHPAGAFEWDETRDFNVEEMHDLAEPWGIWSDGETMWVLDRADNKIHAFDFDTRARRQGRTISTLTAGSGTPHGLWSDGRTIWTADRHDDRLYAFDLATGAVRTDLGFAVRSRIVVAGPEGLWSDGDTVWVSQLKSLIDPERLYAWDLATGERRSRHDIIDHSLVSSGFRNVWSDGKTMWAVVRGIDYNGIFAYDLGTGERLSGLHLTEAFWAGNRRPSGLWSNGRTMWVADEHDGKLYAYEMPVSALLSSLKLSGVDFGSFNSGDYTYRVHVPDTVTSTTVTAGAAFDDSDVVITPDDSNSDSADGHQVDIGPGGNLITVTVTNDDDTRTYNITVTQIDSSAPLAWNWARDITLHTDNDRPRSIWSAGWGWTMLVLDDHDDKVYAYNPDTSDRRLNRDITKAIMQRSGNHDAAGLWSDGDTLWVADHQDNKLYAYVRLGGTRLPELDIGGLGAAGNDHASGLWSDGETVWVADQSDNKVYAYDLDTGARLAALDIGRLGGAGNDDASGLWSDGETMWVTDSRDRHIYAYELSTGTRQEALEFTASTLGDVGNHHPEDMWSNGRTMWVTDHLDGKLYAYNMLPAPRLRSLRLMRDLPGSRNELTREVNIVGKQPDESSADDFGYFAVGDLERTVMVPPSVTSITVTVEPLFDGHTVSIEPADADGDSVNGHQVSLVDRPVAIRATVDDGSGSRTYTVTVRGPEVSIGHVGDGTLVEGDDVVFTVRHDGTVSEALAVTVNVEAPASLVADSHTGDTTVEIAAGDESATLTVPTLDGDGWAESLLVTARQVAGSGYTISSTLGSDSRRVNDNDFPEATARLAVSRDTVAEGGSVTATVTVTTARDEQPHKGAGTIRLRTADGTATAGTDYTALSATAGTFSFAESDFGRVNVGGGTMRYRASRQATITTVDDDVEEQAETFTVSMTKVTTGLSPTDSNIELAAPTSLTVTIAAGDEHRVTSVTIGDIHETGATATVRIANPSSTRQTVHLRYSTDGTTWSDPPKIRPSTEPSVTFTLTGLEPGTQYQVQASLDDNFATGVETATFTTASTTPITTGVTDPITTPIITGGTPGGRGTTGVSGRQDDGGGDGRDGGSDEGGFSDLGDAGVHEADVRALASEGVLAGTGCGDGRLCPDDAIPRWEIAVWLVRVLDGDNPEPGESRFDDVDDQAWWAPHVERLADLEITEGCSTDPLLFCPQTPTTRAHMAAFLNRARPQGDDQS